MKYSEEFEKPDYTKGPYPTHHSVGGKSMVWAPKAQPRVTGDILKSDTDDMPIGLSYGPGGNKDGDFGPYVQRCGEGLPNSFSLDFTNKLRFSGGAIHPHTGLMLFSLALNLRPKAIIETGTANGYSTLYLAKALEVWGEGKVYTVDTQKDIAHPDIQNNPYVECITDLGHNVIKRMGKEGMEFSGPAKVYDSEEDMLKALEDKDIGKGDVVVIRYEGPKGGPGMPEMLTPTSAIMGAGLGSDVAMITDGRFSGGSHGFIIGHVVPEAQEGGPIALIKTGDVITVNGETNVISVDLSDEELAERKESWVMPAYKASRGTLYKYIKNVKSASDGCVTDE